MTLSLTCDPAQIEAHKAALVKKHADLDAQINELSRTAASRIINEATIKRLKNEKIRFKRAITACNEHLAKLATDAARKAREMKSAETAPEQDWHDMADMVSQFPLPEEPVIKVAA